MDYLSRLIDQSGLAVPHAAAPVQVGTVTGPNADAGEVGLEEIETEVVVAPPRSAAQTPRPRQVAPVGDEPAPRPEDRTVPPASAPETLPPAISGTPAPPPAVEAFPVTPAEPAPDGDTTGPAPQPEVPRDTAPEEAREVLLRQVLQWVAPNDARNDAVPVPRPAETRAESGPMITEAPEALTPLPAPELSIGPAEDAVAEATPQIRNREPARLSLEATRVRPRKESPVPAREATEVTIGTLNLTVEAPAAPAATPPVAEIPVPPPAAAPPPPPHGPSHTDRLRRRYIRV